MNWFCLPARASDTSVTIRDTVDFESPTVSPIICKKLPLAKKRKATRSCTVGVNAWFRFVWRWRSSLRRSVKNSMESRPNRYWHRSSSLVKLSRDISCCLNCFSLLSGTTNPSNKSAILFVDVKLYSPISELIDLDGSIKFNPRFNPRLAIIGVWETQSNPRLNFNLRLAKFNPRLVLIGFRTTGAWWAINFAKSFMIFF